MQTILLTSFFPPAIGLFYIQIPNKILVYVPRYKYNYLHLYCVDNASMQFDGKLCLQPSIQHSDDECRHKIGCHILQINILSGPDLHRIVL